MISLRPANERGLADHGWLKSFHTFSFADYYAPSHMGFRALRVINEDRVQPGKGFGTHSHRDMEILSYVIEGALEHKDSMGTGSVIKPGDVQRMSAGTGVSHSEFNASKTELVHFLQIWIVPDKRGNAPSYEQKAFPKPALDGKLVRVASNEPGSEGACIALHADAHVYAGAFKAGESASLPIKEGRYAWVHVAKGNVRVNGHDLGPGDGAALSEETSVEIHGIDEGEVLVFDLA